MLSFRDRQRLRTIRVILLPWPDSLPGRLLAGSYYLMVAGLLAAVLWFRFNPVTWGSELAYWTAAGSMQETQLLSIWKDIELSKATHFTAIEFWREQGSDPKSHTALPLPLGAPPTGNRWKRNAVVGPDGWANVPATSPFPGIYLTDGNQWVKTTADGRIWSQLHRWHMTIRLALPFPWVLIPWVLAAFIMALRNAKSRRWQEQGLCAQCGYDIRATPTRCPECGYLTRPSQVGAFGRQSV